METDRRKKTEDSLVTPWSLRTRTHAGKKADWEESEGNWLAHFSEVAVGSGGINQQLRD
jgi:hypothetical protein